MLNPKFSWTHFANHLDFFFYTIFLQKGVWCYGIKERCMSCLLLFTAACKTCIKQKIGHRIYVLMQSTRLQIKFKLHQRNHLNLFSQRGFWLDCVLPVWKCILATCASAAAAGQQAAHAKQRVGLKRHLWEAAGRRRPQPDLKFVPKNHTHANLFT